MKKLAVIGRGTAGSLSTLHFLRWTDWEIDWYFDNDIKPQAVGEGSFPNLPSDLYEGMDFRHGNLENIDGTVKLGINKINWGGTGNFNHYFYGPSIGYHFNAVKLQGMIFSYVKNNPRIRIINKNVNCHNIIDSDFIMDCSGKPKNFDDYHKCEYIPVNAVHVNQCYWDYPKFQYTLTIARPYGWVFGIPLTNRCSIGYMYNHTINSIDEIKNDIKEIFKEYNLNPSDATNSFHFNNYYKKENYTDRVAYNGNSSFFLEPLEATSISMIASIKRNCFDLFNNNVDVEKCDIDYNKRIMETERMIMLHYLAGSKFETEFWNFAKDKAITCTKSTIRDKNFIDMFHGKNLSHSYGFWRRDSYDENLIGLGLHDMIINITK